MNYDKPLLRPLDLDASLACCGAHGGICVRPPPVYGGDLNQTLDSTESPPSDASWLIEGVLGCHAAGTC